MDVTMRDLRRLLCGMFVLAAQAANAAPQPPASLQGLMHTDGRFAGGGYSVDTTRREIVRLFYRSIWVSSNGIASGWNGNLAACNAGDTTAESKDAVLRRINWLRAMAGVPANVQLDSTFSQKAQQAAMLMAVNNQLSHTPPSSWSCYNATAAEGAGKSSLFLGRFGVSAMSGYVLDGGSNNTAVGHRRWLLYPQTQFMGVGDVDGTIAGKSANALWVQDANYFSARPSVRDDFVAWPPNGYVPYTEVYPRWSISYPNANFSSASVTMTENGVAIPTRLEAVQTGFGENTLVWYPGSYADGQTWSKPGADMTYTVRVSNAIVGGTTRTFSYGVTVFDPDTPGPDTVVPQVIGSPTISLGQNENYTFATMPGADAYQWRYLDLSPFNFADGAESGTGQFIVRASSGYNVVATDVSASGASSFHLAQPSVVDQTLTLKTTIVPSNGTMLNFASRLGLSSPSQIAQVEISTDQGVSWSLAWSQAGNQSGSTSSFGESSFSSKSISLSPWANRTIWIRFNYHYACCGSAYPQTSARIGWYIDDVTINDAQQVTAFGTDQTASVASLSFVPDTAGSKALQVRGGMYGYFAEWGPLTVVTSVESANSQTLAQRSDCLFGWAERTYPQFFTPANAPSSASLPPYYYRFYSGTNTYLATSSAGNHVWVYGPPFGNLLLDVGPVTSFLSSAGCP
jgi:uncharacterized protein YkwD